MRCLYCHTELPEGSHCAKPTCIAKLDDARRAMGILAPCDGCSERVPTAMFDAVFQDEPKTVERIKLALSSAKGAVRAAEGRRTQFYRAQR